MSLYVAAIQLEALQDALLHYALLGVPVGLLTGMGLSLIARSEKAWGGYGSFRRRAARLGHVALVMVPMLAGFYALALGAMDVNAAWTAWATWLWIGAGISLPIALFVAAWKRPLVWLLPLPATAMTAGAVCFAVSMPLET